METPSSTRGRKSTSRSANFSIAEDEALCQAWIYVNEDPIVGAGQRISHYWDRIYENFKGRVSDNNTRTKESVQSRWGAIHRACNRWAGITSGIERTARSGTTIQDRLTEAKSTYSLTYKSHFLFDHCWALLKDSLKWNEDLETRSPTTKRRAILDFDVDNEFVIPTQTSTSAYLASEPIDLFQSQVGDGSAGGVQSGSRSGSGSGNKKQRPTGTKGQKEKLKRGVENQRVLELLREEMATAAAERAHAAAERTRVADQMVTLIELKKFKEDNKILQMDMSNLEPESAEYFRSLQREILQRRREGGIGAGGSCRVRFLRPGSNSRRYTVFPQI